MTSSMSLAKVPLKKWHYLDRVAIDISIVARVTSATSIPLLPALGERAQNKISAVVAGLARTRDSHTS